MFGVRVLRLILPSIHPKHLVLTAVHKCGSLSRKKNCSQSFLHLLLYHHLESNLQGKIQTFQQSCLILKRAFDEFIHLHIVPFESSVTVLFYLCCFFMTAVHQLLSALVSIALEVGGICLERDCYRSTSIVSADIGNKEMLDFTVLFPLFFSERKVVREPIIQATHLQRTIQFPGFCNKCQSRKTLTENCLMWFCTEEKV